jgi:hypothetical protein
MRLRRVGYARSQSNFSSEEKQKSVFGDEPEATPGQFQGVNPVDPLG